MIDIYKNYFARPSEEISLQVQERMGLNDPIDTIIDPWENDFMSMSYPGKMKTDKGNLIEVRAVCISEKSIGVLHVGPIVKGFSGKLFISKEDRSFHFYITAESCEPIIEGENIFYTLVKFNRE